LDQELVVLMKLVKTPNFVQPELLKKVNL
jgi:hypothetical protein